jgi:hypothetical protein
VPGLAPGALVFGVEADKIEGVADEGLIQTWADFSGNGFDATQATEASRPTLQLNVLNGYPVVRFDGSDDRMALSGSGLSILRNVAGASVLAVAKYTSAAAARAIFVASTDDVLGTARVAIFAGVAAGEFHSNARRLNADAGAGLNYGTVDTAAFVIQTLVVDCVDGSHSSYINNGSANANALASSGGNFSDTDSAAIRVGANAAAAAGQFFVGDLAAILVYNVALTTAQRQYLARGYGRKYGITVA